METKFKVLIAIGAAIILAIVGWFVADEIIWSGHSERDMWPNPPALSK